MPAVTPHGGHTIRQLKGVVYSAGLMQRTVKVVAGAQRWDPRFKKHFPQINKYMVHDPNESLRQGDVISFHAGWRTSQHKRHVVTQILAAHGTPTSERPPVPTEEQRMEKLMAWRSAKNERRRLRTEAATMAKRVEWAQEKTTKMSKLTRQLSKAWRIE